MLARPIRTVSSAGTTDARGTGQVESGWHTRSTSWPAAFSPRANPSTTVSVPPYAGAGIGSQAGAMMAMSTRVSWLAYARFAGFRKPKRLMAGRFHSEDRSRTRGVASRRSRNCRAQ